MSGPEDDSDKPHEASAKRLQDLRKQGQIPRSLDLLAAAALAGCVGAIYGPAADGPGRAGAVLAAMLGRSDHLAPLVSQGPMAVLPGLLWDVALALAPLFLLPLAAVLLMVTLQRAWLFTPENLMPRASRISPISNAAQKFGPQGLVGFVKSTAKLGVICAVLGAFLASRLDVVLGLMALGPAQGMGLTLHLLRDFLVVVLVVALVFGGADFLWQWVQHRKRAMMSRQEMLEEHRESEGDPHQKAQRKQRGQDIAMNRMLQDVPKADVVIVNPTHYAVALRWDRAARRPPVCVAKGVDEIAARIREKAQKAGVPIHSDPPTARALHAALKIGDEIAPEHYKVVAVAIRFAEAMRRRAGKRG